MLAFNGHLSSGARVWKQNVAVEPGVRYRLSLWMRSCNPGSPANISAYVNSSMVIGPAQLPSNSGWMEYADEWNCPSNVTATNILIRNHNVVAIGNDFALDDIALEPLNPINISLRLDLLGYLASPEGRTCRLTIRRTTADHGIALETTGTLDSNGALQTSAYLAAGYTYEFVAKPRGFLAVSMTGTLPFGTQPTLIATGGDVDNDNEITLIDFAIMSASFGTAEGDSNYNSDADCNGDGEVNLLDAAMINNNFGLLGD